MLRLEKMQKVRVFGLKENNKKIVNSLYSFGAIQVQECKIAELDAPLEEFKDISEMLIRLRAEERLLNLRGSPRIRQTSLLEIKKHYESLSLEELEERRNALQGLESDKNELEERKGKLLPFQNLNMQIQELESERIELAYFELKPNGEKSIKSSLVKIPYDLLIVDEGKRKFALLAYDKRMTEKVQTAISKAAAAVYEIPRIERSYSDEITGIENGISEVEKLIKEREGWINEYKKKHGNAILELKEQLKIASLKAELPFKMGKTENFSIVEGWIEAKNLTEFRTQIEGMRGTMVEVVKTKEVPPSKMHNPRLIRPFEFMVEFFSLPKSYELDPTLFISITFPIFFGLVMGDIGYGMLSLFAALAIKLKAKGELPRRIGGMLALSAVSAIIFGIIFGEFFGLEEMFGVHLHPLIHRVHEVEEMINISILIGAVHLALGYIIGVVTHSLHKNFKHAAAKLGWLSIEISLIATIVGVADVALLHIFEPLKHILPLPFALAGIVLGAVAVAIFEKPAHLLELPSLIANILSYLRLVALGLSGVIIAFIVNQLPVDFEGFFATITMQQPFDLGAVLAFIAFALLYMIGHIVALLLAILEAGIQSLRLHYVEFFSKFYEGGGLPFLPLRSREEKR